MRFSAKQSDADPISSFSTSTDPRVRAGEEAEVVANCDHLAKLEMKIELGPFSPRDSWLSDGLIRTILTKAGEI